MRRYLSSGNEALAQKSMSDASLVSFLQSELLLLSNEIKKKYPEIKESVENVFQLIRKIKDDPERPNAVEVFSQTELILQPIVLACRTGNVKVVTIAINCLQKLVMFQAFPRECLGTVFSVLEVTSELGGEVQLKALQCLSPLMANYADIYNAELFKLFSIAFKLHESKATMVNNAAAAIVRQMIITLFERVSDEQESSNQAPKQHTADALSILSDICGRLNVDSGAASVLDLSKIDRPFALDLIESIMSNHGSVFRSEPAFADVIKERLCPLIVECFEEGDRRGDFARTCRLWRLAKLIICDFSDLMPESVSQFIVFWPLILKDAKSAAWEKAVVLEIFKAVMCSSLLLESVFTVCEEKLINDSLDAVLQLMSAILSAFPNEGLIADRRNAVLNQFDKPTPPPVTQNYLLLLGFEAFTGWSSNLVSTVRGLTAKPTGHFFAPISNFEAARDRDMQMAANLLQIVGPRLVPILIHLRSQSGEAIARLLVLFAVFEQKGDLDVLLRTLQPFTLPEALAADPFNLVPSSLQGGNGQLMQMLLETSKDLAELLQDSWIWIVRVELGLSQLSLLKERKVLPAQLPFDLDQLKDADEGLLMRSESFSDACYTFFVQSHCALIGEGLARESQSSTSTILLLLKRLQRILVASFHKRIVEAEETSVAWDCVTGTLIAAGKSKESVVRLYTGEILARTVIEELIKHCQTARLKSNKALQVRLLKPISQLCQSSGWPDLTKGLLDLLLKFVGALGEGVGDEGWSCVFEVSRSALSMVKVLNEPSGASDTAWDDSDELIKDCSSSVIAATAIYRSIHELVKSIVADHLSCLSLTSIDGIVGIIAEMGSIKLATEEVNIPLNAVRYLWDVSDHLAGLKNVNESVFPVWLQVLKRLSSLGLDPRPELRNSAVQTMFRTANMNGAAVKVEWKALLDDLLFPFLRSLKEAAAKVGTEFESQPAGFAHFSRDSEAKQWHETESASLNGFSQLLQAHKDSLLALPEWKRYWQESLAVFKAYASESKAEELVLIAVSSLLSLSTSFASEDECAEEVFVVWTAITSEMKRESRIPFCQDSLLRLAKIPLQVSRLISQSSAKAPPILEGFSTILQYATPLDPVRDTENPSELQRFFCSALLDDLVKICDPSLLIEEASKWIVLARGGPGPVSNTFSFGYPSLHSRQSTASSSKSTSNNETRTLPASPISTEYSYIGMVAVLIPKAVTLLDPLATNDHAMEVLLRSFGKYMKAKFKAPGRLDSPLWLLATEAFQSTIKKISSERKVTLWSIILAEMRAALLSSKNMFAPGSEWAEEVDCGWFEFMRVVIIPDLEGNLLNDIVGLLIEIGRITRFDETPACNESFSDFKFPSGVGPSPVAVKEKLCLSAYQLTIELALQGCQEALKELSDLTHLHLSAFITDRSILGPRFPLSRLRIMELSLLLAGCLQIPGTEHLKQLSQLVVDVDGQPKTVLLYCRRILKRLNGLEEESDDANEVIEPVKRPQPDVFVESLLPSRPHSPIVLPDESRPLSPASKRSFSEAIIHNFRSMELFDSGE